jgi:hypothetical protein
MVPQNARHVWVGQTGAKFVLVFTDIRSHRILADGFRKEPNSLEKRSTWRLVGFFLLLTQHHWARKPKGHLKAQHACIALTSLYLFCIPMHISDSHTSVLEGNNDIPSSLISSSSFLTLATFIYLIIHILIAYIFICVYLFIYLFIYSLLGW